MLLDMALGSAAPCTSFQHRYRATAVLLLIVCVTLTQSAPTAYDEIQAKRTDLSDYFNDPNGCYYNYQHYEEGDRIVTSEPCLNCTCHNRMLMCYLRVCPFSKAIGQDCTVQKSPDQCCPVISCPEVPVHLLTSSTTQTPSTTTIGWRDDYGCMMNEDGFFPDGAQVPLNPAKPCELCYCIRNRTACVMQECTLHVEGCKPVYQDGVCCPVRYDCDYESEKSTTAAPQISGGLVFSTTSAPFDCKVNDEVYRDGESIAMNEEKPCEHCYCMRGDIVCAVQDCGEPLRGKDCTPETPKAGHCCPTSYKCANETVVSDDVTTLQPASQSDENEAEKYPSNEDAYEKLGENQPDQDDGTNYGDNADSVHTTTVEEILPVGIQEVTTIKNENAHDVVPDNNNVTGEQNILPVSDGPNKINEENKQETSSTKPESTNNEISVGTESDQINYGSTDKPIELTSTDKAQSTQSPVVDVSSNENEVSPTIQTTSDENKISEVNNENKIPAEKPSQDDLAPGLPVSSTEKSVESETQSSFNQDKPQEEITQQPTDIPYVTEKEPITSNIDEKIPEQHVDTKPPTETATNEIQDPTKQSNEDSTGNIISTGSPLNKDTEQTTQKLPQNDSDKTTLEESNVQTDTTSNIENDSSEQSNQDTTQLPQEDNTQTDIPSNLGQSSPNNDNPEENVSSTEIPKVDNDLVDQNKLPVENKPQAENKPETETKPTEQSQDGLQIENVSPTKVPNVANEPIEQNKPLEENNPQDDDQSESEQTSTEQNQDSSQSENVSPTETPKVENEPTEQNKPLVDSSSQADNQLGTDKKPAEQINQDNPQSENVSQTEIPEVENEPTEQNIPLVESSSPADTQPEFQQSSTEQNQDAPQSENVSQTEIPKVENEPTEQNKLTVENSSQANTQSESDKTPAEQVNQDSLQTEEVSPTEISKVENEPTEQNKPLVESSSPADTQTESQQSSTEQNQDSLQSENVSPTEIPKVENEPADQNKPLIESNSQTDAQPQINKTQAEQVNQDSPQSENVSPTEIPKVDDESTEQNKPLVESSSPADTQTESQQSSTEQNRDTPQSENISPTEIPKVENEPTEQNKPLIESSSPADTQPESQQSFTEQNQDVLQSENVSPTEIPKVENEPTEQNKPTAESNSQADTQSESDKTPAEQINQDSPQSENVSPTEIPKVENEPTEQNKPLVESSSSADNQPESQQSSTEQNQDVPQSENVSQTEIPKVENEPSEQNKPTAESNSQADTQSESDKISAEQANQDKPQSENVSPTEIPKVENEPTEQNKPLSESSSPADNQPVTQNILTDQNQDSPQVDNIVPQTEIPSNLNEPQSENVVPQNEASTPQPNEDNNMFVVSPTSPPLFSQNQVKDEQPTSALNEDDTKPQSLADDKTSVENVNADNVPTIGVTEIAPEINNASPQTNDESSTETKPIVNEVPSDGTSSPVVPNEQAPVGDQQTDDKLDSNKPIDSESEHTPTTEINSDVNPEITKPSGVLVDDSSSENEPVDSAEGENQSVSNADSVENQNIPQNEVDTSTNPSSVDEHENDVTTSIPQEQIADNNIPIQPESVNPNEPSTAQDDTKKPSEPSGSDEIAKPTESPVSDTGNAEQSVVTQSPVQNGEFETVAPQDENVNEIVDQTSVSPDTSSDDKSSTATEIDQNNEEVTPQSGQIETSTNVPIIPSSEEPVKSTNDEASTENEMTTVSQVSQDISNIANNVDTTSTTNKYAEVSSIVSPTDAPASQADENKTVAPVSGGAETNEGSSTNSPIQESPNDNVEASTNVPSSDVLNEVNQDSNTDSELDVTQSPTEKNEAADESNKKPTNDANEIVNGKPTEIPQSIGVPSGPDYVIDLTGSSELTTVSDVDKNNDAMTELYENVQPGVPGEGSCLIDFVTYAHKEEVPKSNPCHEKCECLNSIVTCTSVNCPPAPPQHKNCIPLHPGNESWCCPTYMCEGGIEGMLFDNQNQLGSPQLISTVVLEDKPGEENDEKTTIFEEVPSTSTPQTAVEYNTLAPSQADTSSDANSQEVIGATEIPNKQIDDSVGTANDEINAPVTTATNVESEGNAKPSENESPVVSDKPIESDQPTENEKPVENVQSETGKPSDDSAADVATVPYTADVQSATNKPETTNNVEEQNTSPVNTANDAQSYPASSTEESSSESTVQTVQPASDQNQSEQPNPESDGSIAATTFKPSDSVDQQIVDDNKAAEETGKPIVSEESPESKPADNVTDLPPASNVSPVEMTQTPTIVADEKPSHADDNVSGSRPSSIDDIISSVNMVKDAVKNSLETSSKPAEIDYPTTGGTVENDQPTVVPEPVGPPSEDSSPITGDVNVTPQVPTDAVKLPESPAVTESADEAGTTQVPSVVPSVNVDQGETSSPVNVDQGETSSQVNAGEGEITPPVNADQEVSTDTPSVIPDKQESPVGPSTTAQDVPQAEGVIPDKTPEVTVAPSIPNPAEGDSANDASPVGSTELPQVNVVESITNVPGAVEEAAVVNDKTPETSSIAGQPEVPKEEKKPEIPVTPPKSDMVADKVDVVPEITKPSLGVPEGIGNVGYEQPDEPSSAVLDDVKRPAQESGDTVNIPFDTERPSHKPYSSTPFAPHKPSYTPIPQSTWTQKPFHHDSTSEAPQSPDQGFPDEYDDENEAVYGPGTCRYGGKVYVSAQQVPRDDPCDFCFCFRGDIICLQQSCPPPIFGCYQENIQGFCCPRYECPVAQATSVNVTTTTTTTTTTVPPHFLASAYRGMAKRSGCMIHGHAYRVGEEVAIASNPCLECKCGANGSMNCEPRSCSPEPLIKKMMTEPIDQSRRR